MSERHRRTLATQLKTEVPPLRQFQDAWGSVLPLLNRLSETPQDPGWHAEGDVEIHTQMVLEEVERLLESGAAEPADRPLLAIAAALHDVAKPVTTTEREIRGVQRVVAPRHADRGRSIVAQEIFDVGLSPELALAACELVGAHHEPKSLVVRNEETHKFRAGAGRVDSRLVYLLELADMRGRTCADQAEQVELIELFRAGSELAGSWSTRDPFQAWRAPIAEATAELEPALARRILARCLRDGALGHAFDHHAALARSYKFREPTPTLTLIVGPSGSGKSSAAGHPDRSNSVGKSVVISLDQIRENIAGARHDQSKNGQVIQAAKRQLRDALAAGENVIWDATSLVRARRQELLALAEKYGAFTRVIAFVGPRAELLKRNNERPHPVPDSVLDKQLRGYDVPWGDEAHEVELRHSNGTLLGSWLGGFVGT